VIARIAKTCHRLHTVVSRAANECGAWRELLGGKNPSFTTLEQFAARVPIVDKHTLFVGRSWASLVCGGDLRAVDAVLLSSGTTSRVRAAGLLDAPTRARNEARLAAALRSLLRTDRLRSVLLNTLPDGVSLTLPGVVTHATGSRLELGVVLLRELCQRFEQTIVVGEPSSVAALLERAWLEGCVLDKHRLRCLVGGTYLHEATRARLCELLDVDPDRDRNDPALPISSMGTAELGMHCLWETPSTIALRRALLRAPEQLDRVCLAAPPSAPCLMTYDPDHLHVEIVAGELVITRLDETLLQPIIRYNTHDPCGHVDRERARELLADLAPELAPQLPDPLIWLYDRAAIGGAP
jgi:phenylacetate-coenzyme A ligase PaaK-like adenylate-forming protein